MKCDADLRTKTVVVHPIVSSLWDATARGHKHTVCMLHRAHGCSAHGAIFCVLSSLGRHHVTAFLAGRLCLQQGRVTSALIATLVRWAGLQEFCWGWCAEEPAAAAITTQMKWHLHLHVCGQGLWLHNCLLGSSEQVSGTGSLHQNCQHCTKLPAPCKATDLTLPECSATTQHKTLGECSCHKSNTEACRQTCTQHSTAHSTAAV